jgi:LytS/YehU family sensor histidine kinase
LCLFIFQSASAQNATVPSARQIEAKVDEYMKFAVAVERFSGSINKLRNLTGTKIGLKNVRERLEKLYGEKGGFELRQDS